MTIYPYYNNTNIIRNILYNLYINKPYNIIGITGNKNDGMDYIAKYIEKIYKYNRLDFERDNIRLEYNKNYVINNMTKYKQYNQLLHYNPIIIRVDDCNNSDKEGDYNRIPYDIYLLNNKDKEYLIRQLKYQI